MMMLGECLIILFFVFFSYLLDKVSWSARTTVQVTGIIVYTLDNYSTLVFRLRDRPVFSGACPGQLGQILPPCPNQGRIHCRLFS